MRAVRFVREVYKVLRPMNKVVGNRVVGAASALLAVWMSNGSVAAGAATNSPAQFPVAAPESVGFSSERLTLIDGYISRQMATGRLPGASVLLLRHGKIVLDKVYGKADMDLGTPLKTDSLFRIYSMTKPVTGVALMILFEQGKWHFDDPV